jgi:hypothetical protein
MPHDENAGNRDNLSMRLMRRSLALFLSAAFAVSPSAAQIQSIRPAVPFQSGVSGAVVSQTGTYRLEMPISGALLSMPSAYLAAAPSAPAIAPAAAASAAQPARWAPVAAALAGRPTAASLSAVQSAASKAVEGLAQASSGDSRAKGETQFSELIAEPLASDSSFVGATAPLVEKPETVPSTSGLAKAAPPRRAPTRLRVIANTVTDPGVFFGEGNTILNWTAGGPIGIAFNLASTAISAALRAKAEVRKNSAEARPDANQKSSLFKRIIDSPYTSLAASGVAQWGVAAIAFALHGSTAGAFIPAMFGTGSMLLALKIPLEKARESIGEFVFAKIAGSAPASAVHSRTARTLGLAAWKIATTPELYLTAGYLLVGGSVIAGAFFTAAGILAVAQNLAQGRSRSFLLRSSYLPLLALAAGNGVGALMKASVNVPVAVAIGLFLSAYVGIAALLKYGGTVEAIRIAFKALRRDPKTSTRG